MPPADCGAYDCNHMEKLSASKDALAGVLPTIQRLAAGAALFRQGDSAFGIFRLVSGRISLVRVTPNGTEVPMHTVLAGELFAEPSLFSAHYHCDAIATQRSEVLVYPKAALTRALRQDPGALWTFTGDLARHVQGLRARLEVGRTRSAKERVLQALRLRCDASGAWKMDGSLKKFAEEIGLSHEALYRTLSALEREGRLARIENGIRLNTAPAARQTRK